jgi:hypothetical protein
LRTRGRATRQTGQRDGDRQQLTNSNASSTQSVHDHGATMSILSGSVDLSEFNIAASGRIRC